VRTLQPQQLNVDKELRVGRFPKAAKRRSVSKLR
jgi:hypothetical protein